MSWCRILVAEVSLSKSGLSLVTLLIYVNYPLWVARNAFKRRRFMMVASSVEVTPDRITPVQTRGADAVMLRSASIVLC